MNLYLAGCDGTGKSTLLAALKKEVELTGINITSIWIRSPKFFSKFLMLYCRLIGYTKHQVISGVRYRYHNFSKSIFVSRIFPYLQYIDLRLVLWMRRKRPGIVFFDRFVLDTLADLMVSTRRLDLHKKPIGEAFIRLMPSSTVILVVDADERVITKRKPETMFDPNLSLRLNVYRILAKDFNLRIINNNGELKESLKELKNFYLI